jgi:hypothetical protein
MATWHQRKAGLAGLYEPHSELWKIVIDPPGDLAFCFFETTREEAEKISKAQRGIIVPPNRKGNEFASQLAVLLSCGQGADLCNEIVARKGSQARWQ